jgi:hypothetical protein
MFGKIVKKSDEWYECKCQACGWIGSSEDVGTDCGDSGDTDLYCPRCGCFADDYEHEYYPFHYLITNLISIFKAWRIRTLEEKNWKDYGL